MGISLNKLITFISIGVCGVAYGQNWEQINKEDGVTVWRKETPDSDIIAFKGSLLMKLPMSKIAYVLMNNDIQQKKRWIDMVQDFAIIYRDDKSGVSLTYSSYDLPFPISDRDFVIRSEKTLNKTQGLALNLKSGTHEKYHPDNSVGVRGKIIGSSFKLQQKSPNETLVTVTIQSDPDGLLPTWVVNIINKKWPYNTLMALRKESARPGTPKDPEVEAMFPSTGALSD